MYYLQLTVYEEHGDYNCHAYLWRKESEDSDQLVDSCDCLLRPLARFSSEHDVILHVMRRTLSGMWESQRRVAPGESLF